MSGCALLLLFLLHFAMEQTFWESTSICFVRASIQIWIVLMLHCKSKSFSICAFSQQTDHCALQVAFYALCSLFQEFQPPSLFANTS